MTYRTRLTLALLAAVGTAACAEPASDEAAPAEEMAPAAEMAANPDEAALEELAQYWETHYNMQHADMVASVHAEDGWWLPADGSYHQGRAAIEAALGESVAGAPTIDIEPLETRFFGDMALSMGQYSISVTAEGGEAMEFSGTYMNAMSKEEGEWQIEGSIANYSADPPEGWDWAEPMTEVPEEGGANSDLADEWEAAWNAGDVDALMGFYAEDVLVSFSNGPVHRSHDELRADLEARMVSGATIEIFNVGSQELEDGWMGDGGWYRISGPDGAGVVQSGWYMSLLHVAEDGTRTIHWSITNGVPSGGM